MELKKTPKANLENKRSLFILLGLVIAVGIVFIAFNMGKEVTGIKIFDQTVADPGTDALPTPPLITDKTPPPPPKPLITQTLVITDNNSTANQLVLDPSEIDFGEVLNLLPVDIREDNTDTAIDSIFVKAEINPEFPGGEESLLRWIARNVKYPAVAIQNGVEGVVYVNFVVNKDGKISHARVMRPVDPSLDAEALRVVESLPEWQPGMQQGKPVRVSYTIPIRFKLAKS